MNLLTKVSLSAICSATALFVGVTSHINTAQAALYKFSFEGEGVNGYFTYDSNAVGTPVSSNSTAYYGGGYDYKFDLGEFGVFEGSVGNPIVFLPRREDGIRAPETDDFEWEVRAVQRQPASQYTFVAYFHYPKGSFGGSTAIRTTVPTTAVLDVYPNVDFPNSIGNLLYSGTVQTRIEKVPEPTLLPALLGVGAWFLLRRQRQRYLLGTQM
ncbi:PEP-CTERM sorting domain-containing protein [Anabaena azotica]|uniref:PEP-CTERM sorting domain-containing protein n=1 Tax=Anabaena azotica FACHB-119 TaxID=947527 RepID=A0ABR8D2L9_9NOST|nr:PEP-CTERM sorting domain-containing protein [Anabaena azotica]MBD2500525.1 PEP-CTERM sorting domain-containing protein [Anabaena azotica FACHB-119]